MYLDTIPGRQSMAACYFLQKRFYDVLVYLSSIKVSLEKQFHSLVFLQTYFYSDDIFNFNYAQAKAHEEKWIEAEEVKTWIRKKTKFSFEIFHRHFF